MLAIQQFPIKKNGGAGGNGVMLYKFSNAHLVTALLIGFVN